ncbi:hypothetical protein ES332_D08G080000v1 [Gossypium tomentosum]|uniref:NAB domain-containing protein n=1 Tax=Gossypium tomentosum TaxID=34277 RepID=A0A5D2JRA5_GOSTO|nr:hypothetical protein ES332_D08G080000v1 [Gossypium tomentosum]
MATVKHADSKGMYSWWWNSHISPKNSKWLQENLTDMDAKVKQMIKLIEEDADSFARRAEMYYKKRPELMKLVEEFYRAYRALAERYDHATGVLRQAHQTMTEAFPNQVPVALVDDSPGGSAIEVYPRTLVVPPPVRALLEPDELQKGALELSSHAIKRNKAFIEGSESVTNRKGLKQFYDLFGSEESTNRVKFMEGRERKGHFFHDSGEKKQSLPNNGGPDLRARVPSESERVTKAEMEISTLKSVLSKLEAEKEAGLLEYQQSLERLSSLEREVSRTQEDSWGLNERASQAEVEVQTLKDALTKAEVERDANLVQYQKCLEKVNNLENNITHVQKGAGELNERASKAKTEAQALKQDIARVEAEKEDALARYKQCSETIINLEEKLLNAEESFRRMTERAEKAESELETLKQVVFELTKDKEVAELQYQRCLETISSLEHKLACAQEEAQRLNSKIDDGAASLKGVEERCSLLERTNQSLHTKLESLVQKVGDQSQELTEKQKELGGFWTSLQEERLRFMEAEIAFQTLQHLHSQSQEELRSLAMELENRAQILQVTETCKRNLEEELQRVKEENKGLNERNLSSIMSIKNLQDEILSLRETIAKLEAEVALRVDQRNALQQGIYCLKEELNAFSKRHQDMTGHLESVGLNPETFASTVKELQDENTELKYACERDRNEKVDLLEKLKTMEKLIEKNALLENSVSDLNVMLESVHGRVKELEESCQSLLTEKSTLAAEKDALISQLQIATENLEKLSEKNNVLENFLFDANVELGGLRVKVMSLENSCLLLGDEKSGLIRQREGLISELSISQKRLEDSEKRYRGLEKKYMGLEKERELTLSEVEELQKSLDAEKQEYASFMQLNETRVTAMKSLIRFLQGESLCRKKEYEEELDRSMNAHVESFILQKCAQDMEEKNLSLLLECGKLLEASNFSEKLISELELRNSEKEMEIKSLFDRITILRIWLYQMLKALEIDVHGYDDEIKQDQLVIDCIFGGIQKMQNSHLKSLDDNQQFIIENSVLIGLLGQLKLEAENLATEKNSLHQEFKVQSEQFPELKTSLFNTNAELEISRAKLKSLESSCLLLGEEKSSLLTQRKGLISELNVSQKRLEDLEERNQGLEEKYVGLEKEIESTLCEVEELQKSLDVEKQEYARFVKSNEARVTSMESQIHFLQGESLCRKKEYEEELDKAMIAHVETFILQRCAQDLEAKNLSLLQECSKLLEDSRLSKKLIFELELRNSQKQVEIESLSDQITILRMGLYQMLRTLDFDAIHGYDDTIKQDQSVLDCISGSLQKMQNLLIKSLDENQQFIIENSVLIGLLGQLKLEAKNLATENNSLHQELKVQSEQFSEVMNYLCDANVEVEGLSTKLKSLEISYQLLGDEKSGLLTQREGLISELNISQKRMEDLENRYQGLEEKHEVMKKERESMLHEVEELQRSLDAEKQQHASFVKLNETGVTSMESQIHFLQGESLRMKKEYEEELDKAMNAHVETFILQKCAQDLEEKNLSLVLECRNLLEASKLSKELISELELGNSIKQTEIKALFDQISIMRMGIYQMLRTLEVDAICGYDDTIKQNQSVLDCIFGRLQKMQNSLLMSLDENQQFIIENSVLIGILRQLKLEAENLTTENNSLRMELKVQCEQFSELQNKVEKIADINEELRLKVIWGVQREKSLRTEIGSVCEQLSELQRAYQSSIEENHKVLDEKRTLVKEVSDLGNEKHNLEEENCNVFAEAISQSNIALILKNIITDNFVEIKHLCANLDKLKCFNDDLEGKLRIMEIKLEETQMVNLHLKDTVQNLENELVSVRSVCNQLNDEVVKGNDLLCLKEKELLEAKKMLSATQEERTQLHEVVEDLKTKYEEAKLIGKYQKKQILKLSGDYDIQNKEIESIRQANQSFEAELSKLHEELEEWKCREESLRVELQKRRKEVELWETQATALFGELQISTVRGALLEEKACELSAECEVLESRSKSNAMEVEELEKSVRILECENGGLKAQLAVYVPTVVSLSESVTSLESRTLLNPKLTTNHSQVKDVTLGTDLHVDNYQQTNEVRIATVPDGCFDLQGINMRIKAIEKAVLEMEKLAMTENLNLNSKLETAMKQMEDLRNGSSSGQENVGVKRHVNDKQVLELGQGLGNNVKTQRLIPEIIEEYNEMMTKDIMLDQISECSSHRLSRGEISEADDQMLGLWEASDRDGNIDLSGDKAQKIVTGPSNHQQIDTVKVHKGSQHSTKSHVKELGVDKEKSKRFTEPNQEEKKRKILERLDSDAQKLANLQITLQDLKRKVEITEKGKKGKEIEYGTVKEQLEEIEEAVKKLSDFNRKLIMHARDPSRSLLDGKPAIDLDGSGSGRRQGISEQARKGLEKIGCLQLEVQKIQFLLLKLDDEKESRGRTKIIEHKTTVLLRDYLYSGVRNIKKRKNSPFCACVRPQTK